MTTLAYQIAPRPIVLRLSTAAELMTSNPLTFDRNMPIQKASALLRHHGLEAAPVVDADSRPVGVVSISACAAWEEFSRRSSPEACSETRLDWTAVSEIASPQIEVVWTDAPSREVIDALVGKGARRVYAVDDGGALVGVVSMADVLRQLIDGGVGRRAPRGGASLLC